MAIKKVTLRNFRGFLDAEIDLKPLTVLLGSNSAGKSSFGHALAAMSHAHRFYSAGPGATLTPQLATRDLWPIDLGTFNDLRTNGATGPVTVGIETDAGLIETGFGMDGFPGLLPSYLLYPRGDTGASGTNKISFAESPNVSASGSIRLPVAPAQGGLQNLKRTHHELWRRNENQWFERVGSDSDVEQVSSLVVLRGLLLDSITHESGTTAGVLSGEARKEFRALLENLAYLRATRRRPNRSYPLPSVARDPNSPQEIGYAGEWTPSVIHRRAQDVVEYAVLPRIPNTVEEARVAIGQEIPRVQKTLLAAVTEWLRLLGLATSLKSVASDSYKGHLDVLLTVPGQQKERHLIDMGFGASQVLPVLTAGLLQEPGSLYIVDLPEAHLHPRPQTELADFFCSLALANRFSLIETHSEMFIHRLRLRAELDDELKNKIAIYFIDESKDGLCWPPRRVGLGLEEQFRWPVGFLQEAWETQVQIDAARRARRQSQKK